MKIPFLNEFIRVFVPTQVTQRINESDEFSEKLQYFEPS